jgi:hypothetical protein
MMYGYSDRINHALTFAAKHLAPRGGGVTVLPSVATPANVAVILARHGADETTIVAGILHHLLEAPTGTSDDLPIKIGAKFGPVVLGVARDAAAPAADWRHRKRAILTSIVTMEPRALDIRCAAEIHECGSAIALIERLGPEYLEIHGLGTPHETAAWYGDAASALGRRIDWPARALRSELAALASRLSTLIPAA